MSRTATDTSGPGAGFAELTRTADLLRAYFTGQRELRKGLCLLNAGQFDRAVASLAKAREVNPENRDLAGYLVDALIQAGRYKEAATELSGTLSDVPEDVAGAIRLAYVTWRMGKTQEAIQTLRTSLADHLENSALHFHLGTMLAAVEEFEEAELRFTQAINLDSRNVEALISLALCHGAQRRPDLAVQYLERAQNARPHDAKLAMLLAQAAKAAQQETGFIAVRAEMPPMAPRRNDPAIRELAVLLESDPDFAEAFLALDATEVDDDAYQLLLVTLKLAIERSPQRANLHYLHGQILARLGRSDEAIAAAERAVDLDPRYVQALLLLARLYQSTNRTHDAAARLEETVRLGAEYADTYYLLGNLYRDTGRLDRARWAYQNALRLNNRFEAARAALAALAA